MGEHPGAPALSSLSQFTLSLEFVGFHLPGVHLTPPPLFLALSGGKNASVHPPSMPITGVKKPLVLRCLRKGGVWTPAHLGTCAISDVGKSHLVTQGSYSETSQENSGRCRCRAALGCLAKKGPEVDSGSEQMELPFLLWESYISQQQSPSCQLTTRC